MMVVNLNEKSSLAKKKFLLTKKDGDASSYASLLLSLLPLPLPLVLLVLLMLLMLVLLLL